MDIIIFFPEELVKEKEKLQATQEEARKLRNELQKVLAEGDGYRAAAVLAEKSQKEELERLRANYREEIASLQHIMSGNLNYWIEQDETAKKHCLCVLIFVKAYQPINRFQMS